MEEAMADWQLIKTRQKSSVPHEPVTIERLERGLVISAYIVTRHGSVYTPIFERLERELVAMRSDQDALSRAKKLLESYRIDGGVKAIR
jgi:hypothetical protein